MAMKQRTGSPNVSTFADHEVIRPPNTLSKAVAKALPGSVPEDEAIARAEAAMVELSEQFAGWMKAECDRLDSSRRRVRKDGLRKDTHTELYRAAHDIRGQATTFGFPLIEPVADSLCRLIEHTPDLARIPLALIDQHVDAVRAIARKNAKGDKDVTAEELGKRLRLVTDEFLRHENRDRPDYLDGIVSPSIAP